MNENEKLLQGLYEIEGVESARCCQASGMWVIELILADSKDMNKAYKDVSNKIETLFRDDRNLQVIWKIFLYKKTHNRFFVNGTLHIKDISYEGNILTTHLEADDCMVLLTEYDAEILEMAGFNSHIIIAKEWTEDNGKVILPYKEKSFYLWIEVQGGHFHLKQSKNNVEKKGDLIYIYLK